MTQEYVSWSDFQLMTGGRIRAAERLAEGGNVSAANAAAAYRAAAELRQLVDEHVLGPLVNIPPHGHVSRRCCLPPAACLHCCLPAARCLPALLPACTAACLHCCLLPLSLRPPPVLPWLPPRLLLLHHTVDAAPLACPLPHHPCVACRRPS